MDSVLGDILREETRNATQTALNGRKDVDSIFLATNGKNRYIFVLFRN